MMVTKNNHGLTLIELIVTLLLLTIGVAALVKFQSYYAYTYDISKQRSEALVVASKQLEVLKTFEVLTTTSGKVAYQDIVSGTSSTSGNNATYTNTWTVTTNTNPDYKVVNIIVSWSDRRGANQQVNLTGIVSGVSPATSGLIYV